MQPEIDDYWRREEHAAHLLLPPQNIESNIFPSAFQISQVLQRRPLPSYEQISADDWRALISMKPAATLQQLGELIHQQRGITLSRIAMCGLPKQYGIRRERGHYW